MNTTQEKIRQISISPDVLHMEEVTIDAATEAFMERLQKVTLELAAKGTHTSGVQILEAKLEKEMIHFKFDDPDNLIDHVALHLNKENPKASIEVHHTSARS
jgi:hypothetical protein